MPKLHCMYLTQNLLKTRFSIRFPTCFEQVANKSETKKNRRPISDLIDLIDLSQHFTIDLASL